MHQTCLSGYCKWPSHYDGRHPEAGIESARTCSEFRRIPFSGAYAEHCPSGKVHGGDWQRYSHVTFTGTPRCYLVIVDYYSRFIVAPQLSKTVHG